MTLCKSTVGAGLVKEHKVDQGLQTGHPIRFIILKCRRNSNGMESERTDYNEKKTALPKKVYTEEPCLTRCCTFLEQVPERCHLWTS